MLLLEVFPSENQKICIKSIDSLKASQEQQSYGCNAYSRPTRERLFKLQPWRQNLLPNLMSHSLLFKHLIAAVAS